MHAHSGEALAIEHIHTVPRDTKGLPSSTTYPLDAAPEVLGIHDGAESESAAENVEAIQGSRGGWFAYLRTRDFYLVLLLGYGRAETPHMAQRRGAYADNVYHTGKSWPSVSQPLIHSHHSLRHGTSPSLLSRPCGII